MLEGKQLGLGVLALLLIIWELLDNLFTVFYKWLLMAYCVCVCVFIYIHYIDSVIYTILLNHFLSKLQGFFSLPFNIHFVAFKFLFYLSSKRVRELPFPGSLST